jgi:hypothetical protein
MSDRSLTPRQKDLLRRLLEAYDRLQPDEEPFHCFKDYTGPADLVIIQHRGWREPPAHMADLEALHEEGFIRLRFLGRPGGGWRFELKPKAFDHPESSEPTGLTPVLILQDIREGRRYPNRLARLEGRGRLEGVYHDIGSRELFFLFLLFQSTSKHGVPGEPVTVVTDDDASDRLLEWSSSGFLKFEGKDRGNPKYRVRTMWGEFVRQMEKEKKLKGIFDGTLTDGPGIKLYGLRLAPDETQILIQDISAILRLGHR